MTTYQQQQQNLRRELAKLARGQKADLKYTSSGSTNGQLTWRDEYNTAK